MISGSFRAMGTMVMVRSEAGVEEGRQLFEEVEQACSRFRSDSELTRINRHPASAVRVSPMMRAVLEAAAIARSRTQGLVDIGVGGAVVDWGYDRTFAEVEDLSEQPSRRRPSEWALTGDWLRRPPGVSIDLGGIAKGWTCDLAVDSGAATVASAGGDVRSSDPDTTVEIVDPWSDTAVTVRLGVGALATSSATRRRWRVGDAEAHHLIDPRTGKPSESPVLSASAIAATAVEAEAAAKAVLLLGQDGLAWAKAQSWVQSAVAIWHDGNVYATRQLKAVLA